MKQYMQELAAIKAAAELLLDALCYAKECKDTEREKEIREVMNELDAIRYHRIEQIGRLDDQDSGNLLFRQYVEGADADTIRKENGWDKREYNNRMYHALKDYRSTLIV